MGVVVVGWRRRWRRRRAVEAEAGAGAGAVDGGWGWDAGAGSPRARGVCLSRPASRPYGIFRRATCGQQPPRAGRPHQWAAHGTGEATLAPRRPR